MSIALLLWILIRNAMDDRACAGPVFLANLDSGQGVYAQDRLSVD